MGRCGGPLGPVAPLGFARRAELIQGVFRKSPRIFLCCLEGPVGSGSGPWGLCGGARGSVAGPLGITVDDAGGCP